MEYLIDTHVLIWYIEGDPALPQHLIKILDNDETTIIISIVSLWELAIKVNLGKLKLSVSLQLLQQRIKQSGNIKILNIEFEHLNILQTLPHHHRDPFDRLIIAQAIAEDLTIFSADEHFATYPVTVIR